MNGLEPSSWAGHIFHGEHDVASNVGGSHCVKRVTLILGHRRPSVLQVYQINCKVLILEIRYSGEGCIWL